MGNLQDLAQQLQRAIFVGAKAGLRHKHYHNIKALALESPNSLDLTSDV